MMKRLFGTLLLGVLVLSAVPASAQVYSGLHLVNQNVKWRSQRNDASLSLSLQDINNGYIDSLYKTTQGKGVAVGAATGVADTTAPFSLISFVPSPQGSGAASDTVSWFRVSFTPTSLAAGTSTVDSLYLLPQVSVDGNSWESVGVLKDVAYADWTQAASTLTSAIPIKRLAGGTASYLFHQRISGTVDASAGSVGAWPMVRFILIHDISASATAARYSYFCYVTGWSNAVDPNR